MSFENPVINTVYERCWTRAYRWTGGKKNRTLDDGTIAQVIDPKIKSYNSETQENDFFEPRMKLAVIGVTTTIGGGVYDPNNQANNARYYANEVLNIFDQPLNVYKKSATGTEKIFEGLYQELRSNKPQGLELQVNLYFYDFDTKMANRFELLGSARNEWFTGKLHNKELYQKWLTIEPGEQKVAGSNPFIPPKYGRGEMYTDTERKEIIESEAYKAYAKWEKSLLGQVAPADSIDQTPTRYEGEGSQEIIDQDAPINLDDIPF